MKSPLLTALLFGVLALFAPACGSSSLELQLNEPVDVVIMHWDQDPELWLTATIPMGIDPYEVFFRDTQSNIYEFSEEIPEAPGYGIKERKRVYMPFPSHILSPDEQDTLAKAKVAHDTATLLAIAEKYDDRFIAVAEARIPEEEDRS